MKKKYPLLVLIVSFVLFGIIISDMLEGRDKDLSFYADVVMALAFFVLSVFLIKYQKKSDKY